MTKKGKKTLTTVAIIIMSIIVYVVYIYWKAGNDKLVPLFSGVIFALIPALLINIIWNRKAKKISEKI